MAATQEKDFLGSCGPTIFINCQHGGNNIFSLNFASLTNKGAIAGKITTKQGRPVKDAVLMITGISPPHKDIAALTSEIGEYRFDDLIPGNYAIMVNAEKYVPQTKHVRVKAGIAARLDFSLVEERGWQKRTGNER